MNDTLAQLNAAGVSIWLDDLSRARIDSGNLRDLIERDHIVGVTTNPTIFANALASGHDYDAQLADLARADVDVDEAVFQLTTTDVRSACDLLEPTYRASNGVDGRVSIEVGPELAHDTEATVAEARRLWEAVDRKNCYIKIPATAEGCNAIRRALAQGIDVNVTLIFGLEQYDAVLEAYVAGLEDARAAGLDISTIHSVASFFVSRVDTEIDARLRALGAPRDLFGKAAVANARLAYAACEHHFSTERWAGLEGAGARRQRPLWASTGVKDPAYRDTMYVEELVAPGTVNTMPEATLRAVIDHGVILGDRIAGTEGEARAVLDTVAAVGVDYSHVIETLSREGIEKFLGAWSNVRQTVAAGLKSNPS